MKKILLLLISIVSLHAEKPRSPFLNTAILKDTARTNKLLKHIGYVEGTFTTTDDISINYLWLSRPQATATVICSAGFWPGTKEGMATMHTLLPNTCNILLFDARGHGKSTGPLFQTIYRYTQNEYRDILSAIDWVQTQSECPIFLYGICAGAYHSAHALIKEKCPAVVGLIFDSGWANLDETVYRTIRSELAKSAKKLIRSFLGTTTCAQLIQKGTIQATNLTALVLNYSLIQPALFTQRNLNLMDHIHEIEVPIMYIHSYDDTYTDISTVKLLAEKSQLARNPYSYWWIRRPSMHAFHHLIRPKEYQERLTSFIAGILQPEL